VCRGSALGGRGRYIRRRLELVQRDQRVVLLVHVDVLDEPFAQEVVEGAVAVLELLHVLGGDARDPAVRDDERPAPASEHPLEQFNLDASRVSIRSLKSDRGFNRVLEIQ
jgi:hypothetical protein